MAAFSQPASTMRPSTPAVLRPALTSVTRRTLTSALLRERSISFCRLRTFFRSPACDAAKIRCRSRRTFSSAWPQSTWSQSGKSSSGPFTADGAAAAASRLPFMVSNLPFGSGVSACFPPQAHQTRVSALSGQGRAPIRPVMRHHWRRSQSTVPVSRCLSAAGIRFSGLPAPAGELCLPHVRPTGRSVLPDPIGVVTFRMVEMRPGWVPPGPRGRWFAPGRSLDTGQHLPPSSGGPCSPASCIPPAGVHVTRRHRRFTCVHPSGLSPACAPRTEQGSLGLSPGLRTPRSPAAHARAGTVLATLDRELRHRHKPVLLLRVPLAPSDFVSHPPLVIQRDQRGGGVGAVIEQGGGEPVRCRRSVVPSWQVTVTDAAMIRTLTPPISDRNDPSGRWREHRRAAGGGQPDQELRLRGGDLGQERPRRQSRGPSAPASSHPAGAAACAPR